MQTKNNCYGNLWNTKRKYSTQHQICSAMALSGIFTTLIIMSLLLIILSSSKTGSDLTTDDTLGSIKGCFWSSSSPTSCSQHQSDCVKHADCCHDGKYTWVDWMGILILIIIVLAGVFYIVSCCAPGCGETHFWEWIVIDNMNETVLSIF